MSSALREAKALTAYNNQFERENLKLQADYNSALAQENRDWQEMMANSAHQREIKDLKAAGLNPVLSITGGNGAATPSGSAASVSKPNTDMSLPGKVMDMAMAQMNNATQLQIASMQTANALTIAREQIAENRYEHDTPSGNSIPGMIRNATETIEHVIQDISRITGGSDKLSTLLNPFSGSKSALSLLSHFSPNSSKRVSLNKGYSPVTKDRSYYARKVISPNSSYQDIDDTIAWLNSDYGSLNDYYKGQLRSYYRTSRKRTVRRRGHR